ncbi:hypothetical protein GGR52DRAFT_327642 [Hypoxylon sp. FL1284]|nr:hypothetical protein GGR52DRAFT_327642 [Hypoxylon sp. FL1284]
MSTLHNIVDWPPTVSCFPSSRKNRGYARARFPAADGVIYHAPGDYPGSGNSSRKANTRSRVDCSSLNPPAPSRRPSWRYYNPRDFPAPLPLFRVAAAKDKKKPCLSRSERESMQPRRRLSACGSEPGGTGFWAKACRCVDDLPYTTIYQACAACCRSYSHVLPLEAAERPPSLRYDRRTVLSRRAARLDQVSGSQSRLPIALVAQRNFFSRVCG